MEVSVLLLRRMTNEHVTLPTRIQLKVLLMR